MISELWHAEDSRKCINCQACASKRSICNLVPSVCDSALTTQEASRQSACCFKKKSSFHSNWQMGDVVEYASADVTEMHLMFGRAYGSEREAHTRNTSRIVEFCTEKLFPPFIDGLGKIVHLTCS